MIFILMLVCSITFTYGSTVFKLNEIKVNCEDSVTCNQRTVKFKNLIGEYRSLVHLKDTLSILASDGGYQSFFYQLLKGDSDYSLIINFKMKPIIKEINIGFTDRNMEYDPIQLVSLREGEYFETLKLKESMEGLQKRLEAMGYPFNQHTFEVVDNNNKVNINIVITLGPPRVFKGISTNAKSSFIREYLNKKFNSFYEKPFDQAKFKVHLDEAQKELFTYGYYLINLDLSPVFKKNQVNLEIKVQNENLFAFDFKNIHESSRDDLHNIVTDLFKKHKRILTESIIRNAINEYYQHKAFLNTQLKIEISEYLNMYQENVQLFRIFLDEKQKTRLVDVSFFGNTFFTENTLHRMFKKEAFELASLNFYDREYFSYFQEYLKTQYISIGYTQVRVSDPVATMDSSKSQVSLEYNIYEGVRSYVRRIEFDGLPLDLESTVLEQLSNKLGNPFNPITMTDDVRQVAAILQNNGYYFAEVTNSNDNELVQYSRTGSDVYIKFKVDPGPILKLNRILYLGNDKTKKKVILKKIFLNEGELITPNKTREIEAALSATGLFNSVSVFPLSHNSKNAATDLIVKVIEREYGLIEIAPGYRTDLGLKLTGTATYQNLGGYNRSVTLKSTLNQRLSHRTLDPERRRDARQLLEHNNSVSFSQGDVFDSLIDVGTSVAYQTKRFYSFDANIYRINGTLTRDLTKRLSSSLRYQYEDIKQYNATQDIDNGSFEIGAITPSLTYDLRNSQVNPLKGAFFNLSTEFANPYFLSQSEPDLTINYYKLISRNRFYIPFTNGTVAISLVGGVQENLAKDKVVINGEEQTKGYIPNIKVFRLTGMDIVRGFNDEEMNRLPDNQDISKVRVANKAYLANFKLEPRYFINDNLMAGVFYDAGRVFVDRMDFGELRDSVGLTFKILTPVGTLDFDYGIKLLRKKNADGSLEDPGRFHVSIGFF